MGFAFFKLLLRKPFDCTSTVKLAVGKAAMMSSQVCVTFGHAWQFSTLSGGLKERPVCRAIKTMP
jgi:hypothetical protein